MNTNKGFLTSLIFSLLTACDPASSPWLAGEPINLIIDSNLPKEIKPDLVKTAVQDRLAEFGMKVSPYGRRTITVSYDPDCKCPNCMLSGGVSKDMVLAYVNMYDFDKIKICKNILTWYPEEGDNLVYSTITHEMCHVLGFNGHNEAGKGNLCSPGYQDHGHTKEFSKQDIKDICSFGGIKSTICNQ